MKVTVAANNPLEPVIGGRVTFAAPDASATAKLGASRAPIGVARSASVTARASRFGGTYEVIASAAGVETNAVFTLTNIGPAAPLASATVAAQTPATGSPQTSSSAAAPSASPSASAQPGGYSELPADNTQYRLTKNRLSMRQPGGRWTAIAEGVKAYVQAPNGDLYVLNDRGELRRYQLGYLWSTVHTGVKAIAIDGEGTVHALDNFQHITTYAGFDRYYVTTDIDWPSDNEVVVAAQLSNGGLVRQFNGDYQDFGPIDIFPLFRKLEELSSDDAPEVAAAASLSDAPSYFINVHIVKERIADTVDLPRQFQGIGLAQLHRVQYKVIIYYSTVFSEDGQAVLYYNHDHLHLVSPSSAAGFPLPNPATATSSVNASGARGLSSPTIGGVYRDEVAPALMTGPDGTLYKFGVYDHTQRAPGIEPGAHSLWRLRPGGNWESIFRAFSFSVGPDNTLYVLNSSHELQSIAPGETVPTTLARNVLKFSMAPSGTLFALTKGHTLQKRDAGSGVWTTLDVEVPDFAMTNGGTLYAVNARQELRRFNGGASWTVLDRGVTTIAMTDADVLWALNGRQQLRTLNGSKWKVVQSGVQSFSRERDGTIYALTTGQDLKRTTADGTWKVVDRGILSYIVNTNGDLYEINTRQELKREKFGYSWSTLQSNVVSMHFDIFGAVVVMDGVGRFWTYGSLDRYFELDSVAEGNTPTALDFPSDHEVVTRAGIDDRTGGQGRVNFPYALQNDVQYFAPGPEFPLSKEAAAFSLARVAAADFVLSDENLQTWLSARRNRR